MVDWRFAMVAEKDISACVVRLSPACRPPVAAFVRLSYTCRAPVARQSPACRALVAAYHAPVARLHAPIACLSPACRRLSRACRPPVAHLSRTCNSYSMADAGTRAGFVINYNLPEAAVTTILPILACQKPAREQRLIWMEG